VLGLIFLKYISDRIAQRHAEILNDGQGADPEDHDEYTAEGVFWVPGIGTLAADALEVLRQ
jgi:type I restriction enzyme M protein